MKRILYLDFKFHGKDLLCPFVLWYGVVRYRGTNITK